MAIALTALLGLGLPALTAALVLPALRRGEQGGAVRVLGAMALSLATLVSVLTTLTLAGQVGLSGAAQGPSALPAVAAAYAAAVAAGLLGWALQPAAPPPPAVSPGRTPLALRPGERAVWMQRVALAPAGALVLTGAVVVLVVLTVTAAVLAPDPLGLAVLVGCTVLVSGLALTSVAFRVRVDDTGLTAASALGWPRVHVPIAEVAGADVVEVHPLTDFGGWGMRWAPTGRFGIVLRSGDALRVQRRSGRSATVTVDDAETAAGLLSALASRD
ncbi:DUF1648 domain-containing protein [Microbacterium aurum]